MAIASRPEPTISHKKRQAGHHRHTRPYLQTYWPYLPMFAVVGAGAIVNKLWSAGLLPGSLTGNSQAGSALTASGPLTRIQAVAGSPAPAALEIVIIVSALACAVFAYRHWRRLSRWITRGEAFVYRHAWLDITMVFIFTVGFVLTRPETLIR